MKVNKEKQNKNNKLTYKILVYPKKFLTKEEASNSIGIIKNRILDYPKTATIEQIRDYSMQNVISFGYGKRLVDSKHKSYRTANWLSQQVFALDIDNPVKEEQVTYQEALRLCKKAKIEPTIIYTTFSHNEEHHRYRMIFVLSEEITTQEDYISVIEKLASILSVNEHTIIDTNSIDCVRLFYPGKNVVYYNHNAIIDKNKLMKKKTILSITQRFSNRNLNYKELVKKIYENSNIEIIKKEIESIKRLDAHSIKVCKKLIKSRVQSIYNNAPHTNRLLNSIYNNIDLYNIYSRTITSVVSVGTPFDNGCKPCSIKLSEDFYSIASKIKLDEFLGLPLCKTTPCILPEHNDSRASAIIYRNKYGQYYYRCFACGVNYDIFDLLRSITNSSPIVIKRYLCLKFDIDYETDWQTEKYNQLDIYQAYLHSDILENSYPILYKYLKKKNLFSTLSMMIDLASAYVYDKDISGSDKVIFYRTISQIASKAPTYGVTNDKNRIHYHLVTLARLGLIECLKENELPSKLQAYLQKVKNQHSRTFRINCYAIPELTEELLQLAEERIKQDKELGVRTKYFCRETAARANKETADLAYAQSIDKNLSEEVDTFYTRYKRTAVRLLDKQGYTTEKEICGFIRGFNAKTKERYSCYCLPQLIKEFNLERVNYSKQLERKYGIINKTKKYFYGISQILIRKESD